MCIVWDTLERVRFFCYWYSLIPFFWDSAIESERATQGVVIVLDAAMQSAWRQGGSVVEYIDGRLIRIVLKIAGRIVHVIGVYGPTYRESDGTRRFL